ncbi:hypothetical protein HCN44_000078 [Aphidius gifuensis]|uniref:Uncharacterized protein n=1 Tax=Aphidius gifuensis TaxID=684658 RepID=A0A835CQJ8_APHGI|nr:uncharacterized protein LOC122855355 [Aphidius gifuensis]KAF7990273.1 hypothetical protein HCN44_000078 [Aphidius gifuensis]
MSQTSDAPEKQVQDVLLEINNVALKIKQKLTAINELTDSQGDMIMNVMEANKYLSDRAKDLGIKSIGELLKSTHDEDENNDILANLRINDLLKNLKEAQSLAK